MKILDIAVENLKEYENNPRRNDDAVPFVANSIKEFGFKVPIVVDKNMVIIAGHTRLKAAKELGMKTVPCIMADDLTEEQVKAFRLADNKTSELSQWNFLKLDEELSDIFSVDMKGFGFGEMDKIDWDNTPEITEENFEEPEEKNQLECPKCHYKGEKSFFQTVK